MSEKYIFIMGSGRVGSKIYINILENKTPISLAPEMKFMFPYKWEKCVLDLFKKNNSLRSEKDIVKFVDQLWTYKVKAEFWKRIKNGIIKIKKKDIIREIIKSNRTPRTIFKIIIEFYSDLKNKKIGGAVYPFHPLYYERLKLWFPDAYFLYLCRKPRAALTSYISKKEFLERVEATFQKRLPSKINKFLLLAIGIINYNLAARKFHKLRDSKTFLCKFEEFILKPKKSFERLFKFLDIEFNIESLNPPTLDSSFKEEKRKKRGFDEKALMRWENYLDPLREKIILIATKKSTEYYGYK